MTKQFVSICTGLSKGAGERDIAGYFEVFAAKHGR